MLALVVVIVNVDRDSCMIVAQALPLCSRGKKSAKYDLLVWQLYGRGCLEMTLDGVGAATRLGPRRACFSVTSLGKDDPR